MASKVDKNFTKKKDAIKSIELVNAIPTDSTGATLDTTSEDVSYTNGEEDEWLTQDEANKIIEDIGGDLGWD